MTSLIGASHLLQGKTLGCWHGEASLRMQSPLSQKIMIGLWRLSRTDFVVKQSKMKISNDVVKMSEVLPLALLDLRAKIATVKNLNPERLGTLHTRYCSVMRQIRKEKDLSFEELSALSGSSESFLEAAESMTLEMTDDDLKTLYEVYWELAIGEDHPGDFKRLADERLATPYPENGSEMREIREQKELSIKELSTISGLPEAVLEAAESGTVEMTDEVSKEVQRVYWSLSALEATTDDYRRLLADISKKASGD
jgi:ribosome-binding protein aMBF1 (putative translation factor)